MGTTNTEENTVTISLSEYKQLILDAATAARKTEEAEADEEWSRELMEKCAQAVAENVILHALVDTMQERIDELKKELEKKTREEDDRK